MKTEIIFAIAGNAKEFEEHKDFLESIFHGKTVIHAIRPQQIVDYVSIGEINWKLARVGEWWKVPQLDDFTLLEILHQKQRGYFDR